MQVISFQCGCMQFFLKMKIIPIKMSKMLADKGNIKAISKYAKMLFQVNNVPEDKKLAVESFIKGAKKGELTCMYLYSLMCLEGEGIPKNKDDAIK